MYIMYQLGQWFNSTKYIQKIILGLHAHYLSPINWKEKHYEYVKTYAIYMPHNIQRQMRIKKP